MNDATETHHFAFLITCNVTNETRERFVTVRGSSDEAYEDIADRAYEAASVYGERVFSHADLDLAEEC